MIIGDMFYRLVSLAIDVKRAELRALLWSFFYFFTLLTTFFILRPIRDEMGVASGVSNLPWLFTGTFLVMLAVVQTPSSPQMFGLKPLIRLYLPFRRIYR